MTPRRILVVDDLEDTASSLAYLLENMGHQVKFTTSPLAALELAKTFRPEIAFLDIGMPKLDGWSLCQRLKAEPGLRGLHAYAISGYYAPAVQARSIEAGFDGHFAKPLDIQQLERVLVGPP